MVKKIAPIASRHISGTEAKWGSVQAPLLCQRGKAVGEREQRPVTSVHARWNSCYFGGVEWRNPLA